ncbi:MAG: hypothetical protein WC340_09650 [Kiritimatiellia bacterium]
MPLIERLLHPMLADDVGRRCWWTMLVDDWDHAGLVPQHRRRYRKPKRRLNSVGPVSNRTCPIGNRTYVTVRLEIGPT